MDLSSDCFPEFANNEITEFDYVDDTVDIGADDDVVADPTVDQVFDQELYAKSQLEPQNEPEDSFEADEDQQDSDYAMNSSTSSRESFIEPAIISDSSQTDRHGRGRGRGRVNKIPVDANGQPLPPPRISPAQLDKDSYPQPSRIAVLPWSYYRQREDPATLNQRRPPRQSTPLLNFRAEFDQIFLIVDQDDPEKKGYQHACRFLQKIQHDLDISQLISTFSMWSFGLHIHSIQLQKRIKCDLLNLFPENFDNDENRPFWFMFEDLPKFNDPILRDKYPEPSDSRQGTILKFYPSIYSDLVYGGLTTMNCFYIHSDYRIRKRFHWSIRFHEEFFEIQFNPPRHISGNNDRIESKKYKIPTDIIDRAAIFHLRNDGFDLFINMKGNVHELHWEGKSLNDNESTRILFRRQGVTGNKPMPSFSTIRIRIRIKDKQMIMEKLQNDKKQTNNYSNNEREAIFKTTYDESLTTIRQTLRLFLDWFKRNRIHISFGSIISKFISLNYLQSLECIRFKPFIHAYSWAMLCNIGFRMQIKLYLSKTCIDDLHKYSNIQQDEKRSSDVDDLFYRLCIYLHRRSSEYYFLDVSKEIDIGISELDEKYKNLKKGYDSESYLPQLLSSTAYVPSVVITPTTIKIRPLKLCKLNRVLREKRFGSPLNFALVELRDEAQRLLFPTEFRALKGQIYYYLTNGFHITPDRIYRYLHHSQSQVKCKQFWFYYHDKEHGFLSHNDAYDWMGNFDKEPVVAKHAARIALCFTSSDATIQIPAETVTYVRDIKDASGKYTFTDGVGTISRYLRDEIKTFLQRQYDFSVLQIRYGGCKGTLSVDPRLDGQKYQLVIRDSMNKFISDHDILELCKLSAPRSLYLNRQDIVLLENRKIAHTKFLQLQNDDHLWLIRTLLMPSIAYELLQEKLLRVFSLKQIAEHINIVEERFFIKLITTCIFNIIRELISRTRIRISNKKARNMFGIVDEYGVLEEGQVFVQFTHVRENKLDLFHQDEDIYEEDDYHETKKDVYCEILKQKIVITKNPCHHPGDLRTFQAVDYPELRHLKDVVVFPQKGRRPHPNEISGSDLDGDEYVVIWHDDLIPTTENDEAYDYDSQDKPRELDRPITREDINQVVMEISEQDCLGSLSNIHLAYADKEGVGSETCMKLAGYISQEVDAAKTGKHPLTEEEIHALRQRLGNKWPDFMRARGKKDFYPSERILGKLYRSALRGVAGWKRAVSYHGNSRHMDLANELPSSMKDTNDQNNNNVNMKSIITKYDAHPLDPLITYDNWKKYLPEIKRLYAMYQSELLEIINLYHFQDEIDLFCRCESMDASSGGNKKSSLEDSASIEVQNLVAKIKKQFFHEFTERFQTQKCCYTRPTRNSNRKKFINCEICLEGKLAKSACAYIYSYKQSNRLPLKSNRRIISFPWLFANHLIQLRKRNRTNDCIDQSNTIVGRACFEYLHQFKPKLKIYCQQNDMANFEFHYRIYKMEQTNSSLTKPRPYEQKAFTSLLRLCFIEILHDWLIEQQVFGDKCIETDPKPLIRESMWHELILYFLTGDYKENVRIILTPESQQYIIERYSEVINNYRMEWKNSEMQELQEMFIEIHSLTVERSQKTNNTEWTYLDEYIILALQCIAIEKRLVKEWTLQKLPTP